MCDICKQDPCAYECPNAHFERGRRICAWCDNPIWDVEYYDIDNEPICRDCVEACRRFEYANERV